ncbi:MAG: hypothetical protein MUF54_22945 [Polyangiaceae bacterium]|nr:hypothetical protein [Polyangiaceae bacterium]
MPEDVVARVAWLFKPMVDLPDLADEFQAEERERSTRQRAALEEILESADGWTALDQLAQAAPHAPLVGQALASSRFAEEAEARLLNAPNPALRLVTPEFVVTRFREKDLPWLQAAIRRCGGSSTRLASRFDQSIGAASGPTPRSL